MRFPKRGKDPIVPSSWRTCVPIGISLPYTGARALRGKKNQQTWPSLQGAGSEWKVFAKRLLLFCMVIYPCANAKLMKIKQSSIPQKLSYGVQGLLSCEQQGSEAGPSTYSTCQKMSYKTGHTSYECTEKCIALEKEIKKKETLPQRGSKLFWWDGMRVQTFRETRIANEIVLTN